MSCHRVWCQRTCCPQSTCASFSLLQNFPHADLASACCVWGDNACIWCQCFRSPSKPLAPQPSPPPPPPAPGQPASGAFPVCHGTCRLQLFSPILNGYYGLDKAPPPQDRLVLVPEVCRCPPSHGKRDFANVVTLRTLRREYYPSLATWTN